MSAYSTLDFTRQQALDYIPEYLKKLGNKKLEDIMDVLLDEHLYNCVITDGWNDGSGKPQSKIKMTYKELFKRCNNKYSGDNILLALGVNLWYISEGGDPTTEITLTWTHAKDLMDEEEFENRIV